MAALTRTMKRLDGSDSDLAAYKGNVVLIVNVASECGLTPQYTALQQLHEKYAAQGLSILGFPANEFGKQEPGTDEQIASFCSANYGVTFDMFSKVIVKGEGICDLYQYLTIDQANADLTGEITWNFEKFLISRDGEVVARFEPKTEPQSDEVISAIVKELAG